MRCSIRTFVFAEVNLVLFLVSACSQSPQAKYRLAQITIFIPQRLRSNRCARQPVLAARWPASASRPGWSTSRSVSDETRNMKESTQARHDSFPSWRPTAELTCSFEGMWISSSTLGVSPGPPGPLRTSLSNDGRMPTGHTMARTSVAKPNEPVFWFLRSTGVTQGEPTNTNKKMELRHMINPGGSLQL